MVFGLKYDVHSTQDLPLKSITIGFFSRYSIYKTNAINTFNLLEAQWFVYVFLFFHDDIPCGVITKCL
jgi:hypothetical protein